MNVDDILWWTGLGPASVPWVAVFSVFTTVKVPYEGGAWVNGQGLSFRIPGRGPSRRLRSVACGGALPRWRMVTGRGPLSSGRALLCDFALWRCPAKVALVFMRPRPSELILPCVLNWFGRGGLFSL